MESPVFRMEVSDLVMPEVVRFNSVDSGRFSLDQNSVYSPSSRQKRRGAPVTLPDDFLRVPVSIVERWWSEENRERDGSGFTDREHSSDPESEDIIGFDTGDESEYQYSLQGKDSIDCATNVPLGHRYKVRLEKDISEGLGITLKFIANCGAVVRSLSSATSLVKNIVDQPNFGNQSVGVAEKAGIQRGDVLIGVYGHEATTPITSLGQVSAAIESAPTVFYLMFERPMNQQELGEVAFSSKSRPEFQPVSLVPTTHLVLPEVMLAILLREQGLLTSSKSKILSSQLYILAVRSRQWQKRNQILVERDQAANPTSGFLAGLLWGSESSSRLTGEISVPLLNYHQDASKYRVVSLEGIRPALVVRILGLSQTSTHTEYIVWVVDALTGNEWRVLRRFRDFQRLEEEIFNVRSVLRSALSSDFPLRRLSHIYETVPGATALDRACKLSRWLRRLVALLPGCGEEVSPNRNSKDIAISLQRFLEAMPQDISGRITRNKDPINFENDETILSRAVHVYAHRILTLPILEQANSDFVSKLGEQYEKRSESTLAFDVGECMLSPMSTFIESMQECILKGCETELIDHLRKQAMTNGISSPDTLSPALVDRCLYRGVRRAVECEVYVPLMGKLQRSLLGGGASDEDVVKAERRRVRAAAAKIYGSKHGLSKDKAQLALGIQPSVISPSGWSEVSALLQEADNRYSIPCDRIAALVRACRAIPDVFRREHKESDYVMGADDMLPVFIYALSGSSIRDIVALRRLLVSFADHRLTEGEEGYYLTTLDAAVDHIAHI